MPRRWQVLTVVSIAVFMASLDLFIVNIAFPELRFQIAAPMTDAATESAMASGTETISSAGCPTGTITPTSAAGRSITKLVAITACGR
jgi:hypothetical protein